MPSIVNQRTVLMEMAGMINALRQKYDAIPLSADTIDGDDWEFCGVDIDAIAMYVHDRLDETPKSGAAWESMKVVDGEFPKDRY